MTGDVQDMMISPNDFPAHDTSLRGDIEYHGLSFPGKGLWLAETSQRRRANQKGQGSRRGLFRQRRTKPVDSAERTIRVRLGIAPRLLPLSCERRVNHAGHNFGLRRGWRLSPVELQLFELPRSSRRRARVYVADPILLGGYGRRDRLAYSERLTRSSPANRADAGARSRSRRRRPFEPHQSGRADKWRCRPRGGPLEYARGATVQPIRLPPSA